jgi:LysM repeat protein
MLQIARSRRALAGLAVAALLTVSVVTPATAGDEVIVQSGDTLWDLARKHGTTVAALAALNQIDDPSVIRIGQRIVLRPPAAVAAPSAPAPAPAAPIVYVVRPGDTLWGIATHFRTTVAALAQANSLVDPSFIRIGQALAIPQAAASAAKPAPAAPAASAPTPATGASHVVQAGETLWALSIRYGVSVQAIATANALPNASFIRTGQRLVIPVAGTSPATAGAVTNPAMPPSMASLVAARTGSRDLLLAAAREFGVSASFVLAVAWHESGWQTGAISYAGAVGLMQLMPDTAEWVAGSMLHESPAISDPRWNARAGVRLLAYYLARYQGDKSKTLAAYFQGMGSVDGSGIHATSRPYINSILSLEAIFSR